MIIVTGGAGFIGSNLLAGLERIGAEDIVVCDTLGDSDKWRNIAKREIRDLVAPQNLMKYMDNHAEDISTVFHLGVLSSTIEQDADLIVQTNFVLSRKLWKWCGQRNVRFFYCSSYSVYGNGDSEIGFRDEETPEALAKLRPLNPHGWSKHLFDRRVARVVHGQKGRKEQLPPQWVGLKLFNTYGPNEYHKGEDRSVVSKLYPQASAGASARLFKSYDPRYPDGGQVRDFVWVGDVVDVMLWFYANPSKSGLFNVGTGQGRSFNDMASAVFKACGKAPKIGYVDMPEGLRSKYQYYTQADISKLRAAGYDKPFLSLEDGVKKYVEEYLSSADPYL